MLTVMNDTLNSGEAFANAVEICEKEPESQQCGVCGSTKFIVVAAAGVESVKLLKTRNLLIS